LLVCPDDTDAQSSQFHLHRAPRSFRRGSSRECVPAWTRPELRPLHLRPRVRRTEPALGQLGGLFHLP